MVYNALLLALNVTLELNSASPLLTPPVHHDHHQQQQRQQQRTYQHPDGFVPMVVEGQTLVEVDPDLAELEFERYKTLQRARRKLRVALMWMRLGSKSGRPKLEVAAVGGVKAGEKPLDGSRRQLETGVNLLEAPVSTVAPPVVIQDERAISVERRFEQSQSSKAETVATSSYRSPLSEDTISATAASANNTTIALREYAGVGGNGEGGAAMSKPFVGKEGASIVLQCAWRTCLARLAFDREVEHMNGHVVTGATIMIQCHWRAHTGRKQALLAAFVRRRDHSGRNQTGTDAEQEIEMQRQQIKQLRDQVARLEGVVTKLSPPRSSARVERSVASGARGGFRS